MTHGNNLIQSYLGLYVNFEKCLFQQVAYRRLHKTNKKCDGVRDYVIANANKGLQSILASAPLAVKREFLLPLGRNLSARP